MNTIENTSPRNKETDKARQGYTTGHMRPILYISLTLAIIGLGAVALFSDIL
jgi:hypothetical protein